MAALHQLQHWKVFVGLALAWWLPVAAAAQDTGYRSVSSPFHDDFRYLVNDELRPRVDVDGVRWLRFAITTHEGRDIEPGKANTVLVEFDVRGGTEKALVQLIILFEDEYGNALERLSCQAEKINRDRLEEIVQKHKVSGTVLQATRRVYLYFEVTF
jgi:hypothetical protein